MRIQKHPAPPKCKIHNEWHPTKYYQVYKEAGKYDNHNEEKNQSVETHSVVFV